MCASTAFKGLLCAQAETVNLALVDIVGTTHMHEGKGLKEKPIPALSLLVAVLYPIVFCCNNIVAWLPS